MTNELDQSQFRQVVTEVEGMTPSEREEYFGSNRGALRIWRQHVNQNRPEVKIIGNLDQALSQVGWTQDKYEGVTSQIEALYEQPQALEQWQQDNPDLIEKLTQIHESL